MYKVLQRRAKCIGCNACVEAAPARWGVSRKDGKSILVGAKEKRGVFSVNIHDMEFEENNRARLNCPVKIIELVKI